MTPKEIEHERMLARAVLAMPHLGEDTIEMTKTLEVLIAQVVASSSRPEDWSYVIEAMAARALRYAKAIPDDFLAEARKQWPKEP